MSCGLQNYNSPGTGYENSSEKTAVGSGVSFKYDPFGRRIYKSSSAGTSIYAYDRDNLISVLGETFEAA
jgi:hypothetical protein